MVLSCSFLRLARTAVVILEELFMLSAHKRSTAGKSGNFFNRRERFDVQYQTLASGLLVNIDHGVF